MCLAQGNNTPTRPRIVPGSPDPESNALTTRPVCSPTILNETIVEIQKSINCLKIGKSCGLDRISNEMLKTRNQLIVLKLASRVVLIESLMKC